MQSYGGAKKIKFESKEDEKRWMNIETNHGYTLLERLGEGSFG